MTKEQIHSKIKKFVKDRVRALGKNKFSKLCKMGWGKIYNIVGHKNTFYDVDYLIDTFEIMLYEFNKNLEFESEEVKARLIKW